MKYKIRPTLNRTYLDIVHDNARPGDGALVRVPVRTGREARAREIAEIIVAVLDGHDRTQEAP